MRFVSKSAYVVSEARTFLVSQGLRFAVACNSQASERRGS